MYCRNGASTKFTVFSNTMKIHRTICQPSLSVALIRPSKSQPVFPKDSEAKPFSIYFNYHVAEDGLKVVKTNPKF